MKRIIDVHNGKIWVDSDIGRSATFYFTCLNQNSAVVDVWDALRNPCPYREAWPAREIEHFLEAKSGRLFDTQVIRTFLQKVAR